ncbi:hypothetical protein Zmor_017708 [Zophobas morio]|uniref:Glycosyltransferase family 92 protein n=1 Tax=Zophobas morio TaxID=2755281 RepID=A0AA38I9X1_9CUCU|nr:hypothetical protein Zmor_017708 [Zophobas morio]
MDNLYTYSPIKRILLFSIYHIAGFVLKKLKIKKLCLSLLALLILIYLLIYTKLLLKHSEKVKQDILQDFVQNPQKIVVTSWNSEPEYQEYHSINNTGNLADIYLNEKLKVPWGFNQTCARFPDLFDLQFRNNTWQLQKTTNGIFHLLNAYLDLRKGSLIRIVATYDVSKTQETFYCQFWYNNNSGPTVVSSEVPSLMFRSKWGVDNGYFKHPYLITCSVVLDNYHYPVSVSLVEQPCGNASNNLKIFHKNVEKKKTCVVCVKGLFFPFVDKSTRLVEWIELISLLGAEKIHFYKYSVHPNIQKILDYYVKKGLTEVTPFSLVGDFSQPFLQGHFLEYMVSHRRLQEVVSYNDCFYKHLHQFDYVVLLDVDEVIVPLQATWMELIRSLQKRYPSTTSFMARNVYFFDSYLHEHGWFSDIPRHMYMLQNVYRARIDSKSVSHAKGFHRIEKVITLHNHLPINCFQNCVTKTMNSTLAQLQHYHVNCTFGVGDCDTMKADSVLDNRVWQFKNKLIMNVQRTLGEVGLD